MLVCFTMLNPGEQVELLQESQELEDLVLTDQDRELLVTCVEEEDVQSHSHMEKWHRKVNLTQRRHAVASAVAASAVPSLVLARGHRSNQVPEIPLVVDNLNVDKTSTLIETLEKLGLKEELDKVKVTKKVRAGQGKYRNRRYRLRKGPLVVYGSNDEHLTQTARNIPGVELCHIDRLNLLQLSPGGHLGRLIVWTRSAFTRLNHIFGTVTEPGVGKKGYVLERPLLTNANLARIINSDEVQSVVRPKQQNKQLHDRQKKNPLKNRRKMDYLNPFDKQRRTTAQKTTEENKKNKETRLKNRRAQRKANRKSGRKFIRSFTAGLKGASNRTEQEYKEYIKSTKVGKDAMKEVEEDNDS